MSVQVLMVIDGDFRYAEPAAAGAHDFTFTAIVTALTAAGIQVTKANRSNDATANIPSFNFATSVNLLDYDVIWMIGREGRNVAALPTDIGPLSAAEFNAIAHFMEAGGGVFATGDHDSIGSSMCGQIPRVRVMRSWYGAGDPLMPPALASVPANFPPTSAARADTTLANPGGSYPAAGHVTPFVWFENQSDTLPQPITPATTPTHPILRSGGHDITIYPDHMHEGQTQGVVAGFDYTQNSPFGDMTKPEFRVIAGHREMPQVIATSQGQSQAVYYVSTDTVVDPAISSPKTVNSLSTYDGRVAGVGRIVTGSTFHHYIDINLTGDSNVNTAALQAKVGPNAAKGHGLTDNAANFGDITAVYANVAQWLARPHPSIGLILERSTFSQDEVNASSTFAAAVLITVDGLKPSQFPGGGITTLTPSAAQLAGWAPVIAPMGGVPVVIEPTGVASDDPTLADRLQRFTFTYQVRFTGPAFGFAGNTETVKINAALNSPAVAAPLTDQAWLELVKSANPFMLKLADGNTTYWLSSDVKVFHVVEGQSFHGVTLPTGASRADALNFLQGVIGAIDTTAFSNLPSTEAGSVLSSMPYTTSMPPKRVYNFALARVRLSSAGGDASPVRVFFRIFVSQTTAALTYHLDGSGMPIDGYLKTAGLNPIALPGTQNGGTEWLTFPMFAAGRVSPPSSQPDPNNVQTVQASVGYKIFGALIDNNLDDPYLTPTPVSGGLPVSLPSLLMGEHQCVVAQIEFAGTPIPDGANTATSDKLSQRNLAISPVANPGLSASRMAMHTFEIEATPGPIMTGFPPDELLLDWSAATPKGAYLRIHIPTWNSQDVVALADRFYPRHEIQAVDAHTIEIPGGGVRYVPIPQRLYRQTGVILAEFPLGVREGQRFDLSVRQVTSRARQADVPPPKFHAVSLAEAQKLYAAATGGKRAGDKAAGARAALPYGVFDLGNNRTLVTDLSVYDSHGDHALVVEHPDPAVVAAARHDSGRWREVIGAFQLGVPVSTKGGMLLHHLQLLSMMSWRLEHLDRKSRWYKTFAYYVALLAGKVRALGGDPDSVPPTPDGLIPLPGRKGDEDGEHHKPCLGGDGDFDDRCLDHDDGEYGAWRGKITGLLFDSFGDFEGFVLQTYDGAHHRFFSRETGICHVARDAWLARQAVTILTDPHSHHVRRLFIRGEAG